MCQSCPDEPEEPLAACTGCADEIAVDATHTSNIGDDYCETCYNDNFVTCTGCDEEIATEDDRGREIRRHRDSRIVTNTGPICESCFDDAYACCELCNRYYANSHLEHINDSDYCEDCVADSYTDCAACGDHVHNDYVYNRDSGSYCEGCVPEDEDEDEDSSGTGGPDFEATPFAPVGNTYHRTGSTRKFSVELETEKSPQYYSLRGQIPWATQDDGSTAGKEFKLAPCSGDKGLEAIEEFCGHAARLGFQVAPTCGFHAHFDQTASDITELKAVAAGYLLTQRVWQSFVSNARRNNIYCGGISWTLKDLDSLDGTTEYRDWAKYNDRYQYANVAAYAKHGTMEIRLHGGTLDREKVCNWVVAHLRFIDWCEARTKSQIEAELGGLGVQAIFNKLAGIWGDEELTAYFVGRAAKFGHALGNPLHFATTAS